MKTLLKSRKSLLTGVTVLVLALATPAVVRADDDALYHQTLKSTGYIETPELKAAGTCWVIDQEQKLVITNRHVVGDKNDVFVIFPQYRDGNLLTKATDYFAAPRIKGKVLYRDELRDLAVVRLDTLPSHVVALKLADKTATPGTRVLAVGNSNPQNIAPSQFTLWKLRTGELKAKSFRVVTLNNGQPVHASVFNSTLNSRPGDSGGPVVNPQGELVAVTSYGNDNDSFAIDVSEVKIFLARAFPSLRGLPGTTEATGTWTLSVKRADGQLGFASLTLRADGTCTWEFDRAFEGTYSYANGELTLAIPGLGVKHTVAVTWSGSSGFRMVLQGLEFTAERR